MNTTYVVREYIIDALSCLKCEVVDERIEVRIRTLKMVCPGFLTGTQLSMGRGTLGITGFFMGIPGAPPPISGGGGTAAPERVEYTH